MKATSDRCKVLFIAPLLVGLLGFSLLTLGQNWVEYAPPGGSIQIAAAATPMYVKFEGVDGEAQDKDHKGWSDLMDFQQGHAFPEAGSGLTSRMGSVTFDNVVLTKPVDKASPKLAESVCKGTVYLNVQVQLTRPFADGNKTWYACELKNAVLTKYGISGSGQSEMPPVETITVGFSEIKVTYTEYEASGRAKGNVEYSWVVDEARGRLR